MTRILMRGGTSPLIPVSAESTLAQNTMAGNPGNLLYLSGAHKALSATGVDIDVDGFFLENGDSGRGAAAINRHYDHVVLPLANATRDQFLPKLKQITEFVERSRIPVTVVGVGSQEGLDHDSPDSDRNRIVRRFLTAVLDRSASVGVRGERTAAYFRSLGFGEDQIDVIGCPSVFHAGPGLRVTKKVDALTTESPIAINITAHLEDARPILDYNAEKYPNLQYVAQDSYTLAMLLWGQNHRNTYSPGIPNTVEDPLYVADRIRYFVNKPRWVEFMRSQQFSFGTRIHGNLAAVLAGVPGVVIAHDSRTLELAEHFRLPTRRYDEVTARDKPIDAAELYDEADYSAFNRDYDELFENYLRFLEKNDLTPSFRNPDDVAAYEQKQGSIDYPGTVHSLYADEPHFRREMISRLAWLRESPNIDRHRQYYAPPSELPADVRAPLDDLLSRVWYLEYMRPSVRIKRAPRSIARRVANVGRRLTGRPRR